MKGRALVITALLAAACHDFDAALGECHDSGICFEEGAGGGISGTGGGTSGAGGGSSGTGGGTSGTGGGTSGTGGGTSGTGGGVVNPSGWGLNINPMVLSAPPGVSVVTDVEVIRPQFAFDSVELQLLSADGGPTDVRGSFESNHTYVTSTALTLWLPGDWDAGTLDLSISVFIEGGEPLLVNAPLTVTRRAPAPTLLVDDDGSGSNQGGLAYSAEDNIFVNALQAKGVTYDRFVMPYASDGGELAPNVLDGYQGVVWYTGDSWSMWFAFTAENETLLARWLDRGNKKLVLVSDGYFYSVGSSSWTSVSNAFVDHYLGAAGTTYLENSVVRTFSDGVTNANYGVSGYQVSYLNPKADTQVLYRETSPDSGMPVATRHVADGGSTVVFCGFGMLDVRAPDAGGTRRTVIHSLLDSAGIP